MSFTGSLLLLAAIALVALGAGRLYTAGFAGELFRRFDPAGATASLAVGAAVLTLLSVALSAAGLSAPAMLPMVAALQLLPLALARRRGRLDALRPRGPARAWLSLLAPVAAVACLALLPLLRTDGYAVGNDTYTYGAFSEWLQGHGFSEPCTPDVQSPVTGIPALWQSQHYDLGIAHWLALVQAATRAPIVLLVYPATAALGMVLLVSQVWLAARQLLRLGSLAAGASSLLIAAVPHALYWGHHNGFLQQTYALPLLLFALVLAARTGRPARWSAATASLLALPVAFLVAVYLPLLPTLLVALAAGFVPALWPRVRGRGRVRRLAAFAAWTALFVFLLAGRDLVGALAPLHGFAASVAGGHVPFDAVQFFQFALGTRVLAPGWSSVEVAPWSALNRALTPAYALLVVVGLGQAWGRTRLRALGAAALVLLLGIGYYALAVKDPWSGRVGHTWNVFKLSQWSCPFLLLLGVVGLRRLLSGRRWRLAALAIGWALPSALALAHWTWARQLGETMQEVLPGPSPLRELPALVQRVRELPPGTLLLVGRPSNAGRWLGAVTSLVAYPRAIVGDWTESASMGTSTAGEALYAQLLSRIGEPLVVPVLAGFVPFQTEGTEPLGGGLARLLPGDTPVIVHVMNPAGLEGDARPGRPAFAIGEGRTKIVVLSRSEKNNELALDLRPYPGRPGLRLLVRVAGGDYSRRAVRLAVEAPPALVLPLDGQTALRVPLPPARGLQTVVLVVEDGGGAARTPLTVVGLRVNQAH